MDLQTMYTELRSIRFGYGHQFAGPYATKHNMRPVSESHDRRPSSYKKPSIARAVKNGKLPKNPTPDQCDVYWTGVELRAQRAAKRNSNQD